MTQNEITKIAKEVGFSVEEIDKCKLMFERFAFLVAQNEREACVKMCDDLWQEDGTAYQCREAIKARGKL
jgi:hypothetical protein